MKLKYIIRTVCLCTGLAAAGGTYAQNGMTKADSARQSFNALDYTLQKRYIPNGRSIDPKAPGKNFFISVTGGMQKLTGMGAGLPAVFDGGLSVGKEVSPFNTYRLSVIGGFNKQMKRGGLEIDHLFNLLDYLKGYEEGQHWNLYTVAGLGGYVVKRDGADLKIAGSVHAGLQLQYHLGKNWDAFLEPKVYIYTDGIDALTSYKRYDIGYGITAGINYRFTALPGVRMKSEDPGDNLFIEAAVGTQGDFARGVRSNLKGLKPLGPSVAFSVGKWFMPLGVRGTLFTGYNHTWSPGDYKQKEGYGGARVEAMLNLNTLLKPSVDDPRLEVNLSAGYEVGAVAHRYYTYAKKIRLFDGPTGAVQVLYFVNEQIGVFGEARYRRDMYTQTFVNGTSSNRRQQNLGLMFGVQYRRRKANFDAKKGGFEPYKFAYATVGTNFPVRTAGLDGKDLPKLLGQQIGIGIGKQYTPVSALRATVEVGRYAIDTKSGAYPFSLSADYMFNLTNMVGNYSDTRIFDLNAFAGVVYTHVDTEKKNYVGLQGGAQQSFKLNDKWSLFLEEKAQAYKGKITPTARQYTSGKISFVMNASIGTSYRF